MHQKIIEASCSNGFLFISSFKMWSLTGFQALWIKRCGVRFLKRFLGVSAFHRWQFIYLFIYQVPISIFSQFIWDIRKLLRSVHGSLSVTYDIMNYNTLNRGVFHNAVNIGREMQKNAFVLKYLKKYMTIKISIKKRFSCVWYFTVQMKRVRLGLLYICSPGGLTCDDRRLAASSIWPHSWKQSGSPICVCLKPWLLADCPTTINYCVRDRMLPVCLCRNSCVCAHSYVCLCFWL